MTNAKSRNKPEDRNIFTIEYIAVIKSRPITDLDYINFLVAAQCDVSWVKAAECYSENGIVVVHDKFNRFLTRQSLSPETLWKVVEQFVEKQSGWLILDDKVVDKIRSERIELTCIPMEWKAPQNREGNGTHNPCLD